VFFVLCDTWCNGTVKIEDAHSSKKKASFKKEKRLSHETSFYSFVAQCGINYMGNTCLHADC
jgi:hypothetical protein